MLLVQNQLLQFVALLLMILSLDEQAAAAPAGDGAQVVEISTSSGTVRGSVVRPGTRQFLGIPYAAPPVGDLRWRDPRPVATWSGIRDATRFGPSCEQATPKPWGPYTEEFIATGQHSEDCLTLNVWAPPRARRGVPVFVYVHGGGFGGGAGSLPIYNGTALARRGVVVITINYRVGVFGFLAHPELSAEAGGRSSGNYGLLDQIAALKWVRANIAAFGGDPDNVTLAGESAGAASVNDLMVSELAKGLFQRAVAFSGASMAVGMPSLADGEKQGLALATRLGAVNLAQLRAMPADQLIEATRYQPVPGGNPPPLIYVPHLDGVVIAHDPALAKLPVVNAVPLMTGFNAAEMIDTAITAPAQFEQAVRMRYGNFADRLLALYPHADATEVAQSRVSIARDRYMSGLVLWAHDRTTVSNVPIYLYLYDHPYPPVRGSVTSGAFHTSEMPYVFGALRIGDRSFGAVDSAVSDQWQSRLTGFMRTGNPTLPGRAWQRAAEAAAVMHIGDTNGMGPAVSSRARFDAFREFAASGGALGLL